VEGGGPLLQHRHPRRVDVPGLIARLVGAGLNGPPRAAGRQARGDALPVAPPAVEEEAAEDVHVAQRPRHARARGARGVGGAGGGGGGGRRHGDPVARRLGRTGGRQRLSAHRANAPPSGGAADAPARRAAAGAPTPAAPPGAPVRVGGAARRAGHLHDRRVALWGVGGPTAGGPPSAAARRGGRAAVAPPPSGRGGARRDAVDGCHRPRDGARRLGAHRLDGRGGGGFDKRVGGTRRGGGGGEAGGAAVGDVGLQDVADHQPRVCHVGGGTRDGDSHPRRCGRRRDGGGGGGGGGDGGGGSGGGGGGRRRRRGRRGGRRGASARRWSAPRDGGVVRLDGLGRGVDGPQVGRSEGGRHGGKRQPPRRRRRRGAAEHEGGEEGAARVVDGGRPRGGPRGRRQQVGNGRGGV